MTLLEAIAFITGAPVQEYTEPHAELGEAMVDADYTVVRSATRESIELLDQQIELLAELTALETILEGME